MSVINYTGVISPTLFACFQTIAVKNHLPAADENYFYYLANEAVFEFRLQVETPSGVATIERHATEKNPLYDKARTCYICDPTPAAALEKLADAVKGGKQAKATLSVKIWLKPFFLELLKLLTRNDADRLNLARPDLFSQKAIVATFNHEFIDDGRSQSKVSLPANVTKEIKDIPCDLAHVSVFPPSAPGQPPRVTLSVMMRIKERLTPQDRDAVARIFVAGDYTKIHKFGGTEGRSPWFLEKPDTGIEVQLRRSEKNVAHYLWNHSSLERGETIFKEIFDAGDAAAKAGKSTLDIVKVVRDAMDARMITANHWGQNREDRHTEEYQRKMSDLFGLIQRTRFYMASPVAWLRQLADKDSQQALLDLGPPGRELSFEEKVVLSLQWGVGHCQEHGNLAYLVLKHLMIAGHEAKFERIILAGNANVDHAFVVGGIKISKVVQGVPDPGIFMTELSKGFYRGAKGEELKVVDLGDALSQPGATDGFVCDPYLAPTEIPTTCKELLAKLNEAAREKRKIFDGTIADCRTDFIRYSLQHPGPEPDYTKLVKVLGLRGL